MCIDLHNCEGSSLLQLGATNDKIRNYTFVLSPFPGSSMIFCVQEGIFRVERFCLTKIIKCLPRQSCKRQAERLTMFDSAMDM